MNRWSNTPLTHLVLVLSLLYGVSNCNQIDSIEQRTDRLVIDCPRNADELRRLQTEVRELKLEVIDLQRRERK